MVAESSQTDGDNLNVRHETSKLSGKRRGNI
jgi:hypothetical protein